MRKLPLSNSLDFAAVDDEDYPLLSRFTWWINGNGYVVTKVFNLDLPLHRVVFGTSKTLVDHEDGNKLNNQKSNLREATNVQNGQNRRVQKHSSPYKGVSLVGKSKKPWLSSIRVNRIKMHLGYYSDPVEAARQYDSAALKYFGKFARTNKQEGLIL